MGLGTSLNKFGLFIWDWIHSNRTLEIQPDRPDHGMQESHFDVPITKDTIKDEPRSIGNDWLEMVDPESKQLFYINSVTNAKQWTWPENVALL